MQHLEIAQFLCQDASIGMRICYKYADPIADKDADRNVYVMEKKENTWETSVFSYDLATSFRYNVAPGVLTILQDKHKDKQILAKVRFDLAHIEELAYTW